MSPQDKVERVLKEIHVAFAKSPTYNGQPDKMIVDRKQFLSLLDRLNNGIYDMMEQYEQTRQSRQNAERAFQRKGKEIIDQANSSADDIYAASVIYTADAIGKIRDLMDQTNDSMNDLFRQFRKDLREQKDLLKSHESELQAQLADLADTKKYLAVIQEMNRERARKSRDLEAEKEAGSRYARNMFYTSLASADVKVNDAYFEKSGKPTPEETARKAAEPAEKPDIKINTDAAYFKWKAEQEAKEHAGETDGEEKENPEETEAALVPVSDSDQEDFPGEIVLDEEEEDGEDMETAEYPNPDFPDEESIMRAVLEDEQRAMEEEHKSSGGRERSGAGSVLKSIFFGKE